MHLLPSLLFPIFFLPFLSFPPFFHEYHRSRRPLPPHNLPGPPCSPPARCRPHPRLHVPLPPGPVPAGLHRAPGARRQRAGLRPHLRGQDDRRDVRDRDAPAGPAPRDLHLPDQGPLEPEVPRVQRHVRERGADDGGHDGEAQRGLSRHDDRDSAEYAVPRDGDAARGGVRGVR